MPCPHAVRTILDEAASVASARGSKRAVVLLIDDASRVTIIGQPADVAELPAGLRRAMESAALGRLALLCPKCGGHGAGER